MRRVATPRLPPPESRSSWLSPTAIPLDDAKGFGHAAEAVHGARDRFILNAIGYAEVPGRAEATPRHRKNLLCLQCLHEGDVVPAGCLREDVEGPLRLDQLVPHGRQVIAKEVALA